MAAAEKLLRPSEYDDTGAGVPDRGGIDSTSSFDSKCSSPEHYELLRKRQQPLAKLEENTCLENTHARLLSLLKRHEDLKDLPSRQGTGKKESKLSKRKLKKVKFHETLKHAAGTAKSTALTAKKDISKRKRQRIQQRQKKVKVYDLSELSEYLPDLRSAEKKQSETVELKLNCKSRRKKLFREAAQLQAVISNPDFINNPLGAIHQHLLVTQPPFTDDQKCISKRKKKTKRQKQKKASTSPSS